MRAPPQAPAQPKRCSRFSIQWIGALRRVWELDRRIRRERRRLDEALEKAGEAMVLQSPREVSPPAAEPLALAGEQRGLLVALSDAKARSLGEDRRDYSAVSPWARPLVIARGFFARAVLRNRIARARRDLRRRYQRLAAYAIEQKSVALCNCVPAEVAREVVARRSGLESDERLRVQICAPFGGRVLPRPCHWVAREVVLFARFAVQELRNRFLPRLPALAGLAVGWWIAHTFTDSRAPGLLRLFGFGRASKRYVQPATFKAMSVWLPLLASVVCAYLADRVGALIRRRYGSPPNEVGPERGGSATLPAISSAGSSSAIEVAANRERTS